MLIVNTTQRVSVTKVLICIEFIAGKKTEKKKISVRKIKAVRIPSSTRNLIPSEVSQKVDSPAWNVIQAHIPSSTLIFLEYEAHFA